MTQFSPGLYAPSWKKRKKRVLMLVLTVLRRDSESDAYWVQGLRSVENEDDCDTHPQQWLLAADLWRRL